MSLAVHITNAKGAVEVVIVGKAAQNIVILSPTVKNTLPVRLVGYTPEALPVSVVGYSRDVIEYSFLGTLDGDYIGANGNYILVTGV